MIGQLMQWLRERSRRKRHKAMVKRWYREGGESRLKYQFAISPQALVIDAGGYKGDWTDRMVKTYGCSVLVFEPVSGSYPC